MIVLLKLLKKILHLSSTKYISFDEYNEDAKEEYLADDCEVLMVLVEQKYIDPKEIIMGDYGENIEYPWHGHCRDDFVLLNERLCKRLKLFQECSDFETATRLKKKYTDIYNAYFLSPICLRIDHNNNYCFGSDGRHRIEVARESGNILPVWVVRYVEKSELTLEEYLKCHTYGEWRF